METNNAESLSQNVTLNGHSLDFEEIYRIARERWDEVFNKETICGYVSELEHMEEGSLKGSPAYEHMRQARKECFNIQAVWLLLDKEHEVPPELSEAKRWLGKAKLKSEKRRKGYHKLREFFAQGKQNNLPDFDVSDNESFFEEYQRILQEIAEDLDKDYLAFEDEVDGNAVEPYHDFRKERIRMVAALVKVVSLTHPEDKKLQELADDFAEVHSALGKANDELEDKRNDGRMDVQKMKGVTIDWSDKKVFVHEKLKKKVRKLLKKIKLRRQS
ncbi:hypothetical protein COU77_03500 [Candidatus Peregrinibacteria bacterium CG10_big_fil_rev_8_21_14_0_10_49_16]|nr:MAG: hypothetical protein COW95_00500 [Candidatus Peregrinibacteria bacterium CG22_combo_CG10-13_8_21_14_all_49_11]PIR51821.1 MAG: hypothetical protein COU77_03500 [Candidatus Peregrinibacteria bacterium CG10_big_fil_rev_8_21_14_0_10_49_16]